MTYKLLVTGFDPFGGFPVNPSFQVAKTLANRNDIPGVHIEAHEIPTKWDISAQILKQILMKNQFDGLIMIGLAAKRAVISLEKTAQNLDDCESADNAGVFRHHQIIDSSAPMVLHTNLPVEKLEYELTLDGFSVEVSHSAGNYVCNHLYFHALNSPERPRDVLFVHIPPTDSMSIEDPEHPGAMSISVIEDFFATLIPKLANP